MAVFTRDFEKKSQETEEKIMEVRYKDQRFYRKKTRENCQEKTEGKILIENNGSKNQTD